MEKIARVWGDSAYTGQKEVIREISPNVKDLAQKNTYRNRPLSKQDKSANRHKSKVRARVEHIFGVDEAAVWIEQSTLSGA